MRWYFISCPALIHFHKLLLNCNQANQSPEFKFILILYNFMLILKWRLVRSRLRLKVYKIYFFMFFDLCEALAPSQLGRWLNVRKKPFVENILKGNNIHCIIDNFTRSRRPTEVKALKALIVLLNIKYLKLQAYNIHDIFSSLVVRSLLTTLPLILSANISVILPVILSFNELHE